LPLREVFLRFDVKMQPRTPIVIGAFLAALAAGLVIRFLLSPGPLEVQVKEHFMQQDRGMPVDFKGPPAAFDGTSPILGSDPKPVSQKPYENADDTQLFFLAKSKTGADCCPSVFSSDVGCLCLTDQETALLNSRGGNRAQGQLA
jgi:hypothetical protein